MVHLLSTKQLSPYQIQLFPQAGFSVEAMSFIEIIPQRDIPPFQPSDFYLFTSQNAFLSLIENPIYKIISSKKAFCVGEKTKKLLKNNHWNVIASFEYAHELGSYLIDQYQEASFTLFCGDRRLDTLPNIMKKNKIKFQEILTYRTLLTPIKVEKLFDGILFFSPSAVESFLQVNHFRDEHIFCIGSTTQKALPKEINSYLAKTPTIESVQECCINIFKKTKNDKK